MTTTEDDVTGTIERLASAEELRAIEDPETRLTAAADVADRAAALSDSNRYLRDAAALLLYERTGGMDRKYGTGIAVWHGTIGLSKSRWRGILDEADPEYVAKLRRDAERVSGADARTRAFAQRKAERAADVYGRVTGLIGGLRAEDLSDEELTDVARKAAQATREFRAVSAAAAKVRNAAAVECMAGGEANADVARRAKITTARAAQLRRPGKKKARGVR